MSVKATGLVVVAIAAGAVGVVTWRRLHRGPRETATAPED